MPRKFTEQVERPQEVTILLKLDSAGTAVESASVRATFGADIRNDAAPDDVLKTTTAAITFDGLLTSRSITGRTFSQITNDIVNMVKDVRVTPIE